MDSVFEFFRWVAHTLSLATIGATVAGFFPVFAALPPIIYYSIVIYESKTVRDYIRARKLRQLVHIRAKAVALELAIRHKDGDLFALDEANQVHLAAASKAADLTHDAMIVEKKIEVQKIAEADAKVEAAKFTS